MGILDRFEHGVERAVSGVFGKVFRTELKPIELSSALRRQLDEQSAVLERGRVVAPNQFEFVLAPADLERLESWGLESLADELTDQTERHAKSQRYALLGPVVIDFASSEEIAPSTFEVQSKVVKGAVAPASGDYSHRPMLDIDGQKYVLAGAVTVLGRDTSADITIDDTGISRKHIKIEVMPDAVVVTDLDSTNGLFVEGHRVKAATLLDGNTIVIGRTRILYWAAQHREDEE